MSRTMRPDKSLDATLVLDDQQFIGALVAHVRSTS